MGKTKHQPKSNRAGTCGYYVFFERPDFATSPSGPLSSLRIAKVVARAVLADPAVVSVRVEHKSGEGSREIVTYVRLVPTSFQQA